MSDGRRGRRGRVQVWCKQSVWQGQTRVQSVTEEKIDASQERENERSGGEGAVYTKTWRVRHCNNEGTGTVSSEATMALSLPAISNDTITAFDSIIRCCPAANLCLSHSVPVPLLSLSHFLSHPQPPLNPAMPPALSARPITALLRLSVILSTYGAILPWSNVTFATLQLLRTVCWTALESQKKKNA